MAMPLSSFSCTAGLHEFWNCTLPTCSGDLPAVRTQPVAGSARETAAARRTGFIMVFPFGDNALLQRVVPRQVAANRIVLPERRKSYAACVRIDRSPRRADRAARQEASERRRLAAGDASVSGEIIETIDDDASVVADRNAGHRVNLGEVE